MLLGGGEGGTTVIKKVGEGGRGEGGSSPWTPPETDSNSKNPRPNMGTGELYPHKGYLLYISISIVRTDMGHVVFVLLI